MLILFFICTGSMECAWRISVTPPGHHTGPLFFHSSLSAYCSLLSQHWYQGCPYDWKTTRIGTGDDWFHARCWFLWSGPQHSAFHCLFWVHPPHTLLLAVGLNNSSIKDAPMTEMTTKNGQKMTDYLIDEDPSNLYKGQTTYSCSFQCCTFSKSTRCVLPNQPGHMRYYHDWNHTKKGTESNLLVR